MLIKDVIPVVYHDMLLISTPSTNFRTPPNFIEIGLCDNEKNPHLDVALQNYPDSNSYHDNNRINMFFSFIIATLPIMSQDICLPYYAGMY